MPHVKTLPGGKTVETHKVRQFKMGDGKVCGAKKRDRGPGQKRGRCLLAAGWGTDHPGIGKCKFHGGSTPNHIKAAAGEQLAVLLGEEIETDPLNALMWCIRLAAGEVAFWKLQIAELEEHEWYEDTIAGKQMALAGRELRHARDALANYSSQAIKLGLQERQVRMAEMYGSMLSSFVKSILDPIMPHLSEEGRKMIPQVVREAWNQLERQQLELPKGDS